MKLVLLNGPPRSGKDFAGGLLQKNAQLNSAGAWDRCAYLDKFAGYVKRGTHGAYCIEDGDGELAAHDHFEHCKDTPHPDFFGKTPRQAYIAYSETFMKPLHGPRIFGEILANNYAGVVENCPRVVANGGNEKVLIVTDSGFRPEAEVLIELFTPGKCFLVRLQAEGCSFDGDSRGRIDLSDLGVETLDVINPKTPALLSRLKPVLDWIKA